MLLGVWRAQGPRLMFAKSRARRFLRENEVLQGSKYLFSEGEEWEEGKCRWRILPQVILKGISSKRTAWKNQQRAGSSVSKGEGMS